MSAMPFCRPRVRASHAMREWRRQFSFALSAAVTKGYSVRHCGGYAPPISM